MVFEEDAIGLQSVFQSKRPLYGYLVIGKSLFLDILTFLEFTANWEAKGTARKNSKLPDQSRVAATARD
jgi:hypothetical protein